MAMSAGRDARLSRVQNQCPGGIAAIPAARSVGILTGRGGSVGQVHHRRRGNFAHSLSSIAARVASGLLLGLTGSLILEQAVLAQSEPRFEHSLPLVMSASNPVQVGFVRIVNHSDRAATVQIHAIDDAGQRFGPITLDVEAKASVHFNSDDLESGNADKGLSGGIGDGNGDWRLELDTALDIEPLGYVRTTDGFVTSMHDLVVEGESMRYHVPTFNPGGNRSQVSRLRLINPTDTEAEVVIDGRDDRGEPPEDEVRLTLPAGGARTVSAQELESGGSGLRGRFGDGEGKWHLSISADHPIQVMSLLTSPTGHLANLSTSVDAGMQPAPPTGYAPADERAFDSRVVGRRVDAGTFVLNFVSSGRFLESGRFPGRYSYSNTGPNTGTLTLTYDHEVYGGRCTVQLTYTSSTTGTWHYACASGTQDQGNWHIPEMGLEFVDGESTTRTIPENTLAGINVGRPVASTGGSGASTYTMSGSDADSFVIIPESGQIRTREGVVYDYETKNRFSVTVGVEDDGGGNDTIEVTVRVGNLVSACEPLQNLNINHGNQRLTVRWSPSPESDGQARVLGYQTEIRRGGGGPWTGRRTFLGRNFNAIVYADLDNEIGYQVRVRPVNAEGDCPWSVPVRGIPTADRAPKDSVESFDRFGPRTVGSTERNWRFLTRERCRHTSNGSTLDADCGYENTGPNTGRIFLEFDDPSQGSCEITLLYSSLTSGSFIDECFHAGVNTDVPSIPFDTILRMPQSGTSIDGTLVLAPRTEDEFNELVHGRDDFIPGLAFGSLCHHCAAGGVNVGPGWASRIESDADGLPVREVLGRYTYRSTSATEGVLTFEENYGNTYVFHLDFQPSGNVGVTITDPDGDVTVWPGILHLTLELAAQPILLPIPPSWSSIIAAETDAAPDDYFAFNDLLESHSPEHDSANDPDIIWQTLFGADAIDVVERVAEYGNSTGYQRIGRNRAQVTVVFDDEFDHIGDYDERPWSSAERLFVNSEWVFDITFVSEDSFLVTVTRLGEGEQPIRLNAFIDLTGGRINLNEFPPELLLPDDPPQASGTDRSGVDVAAAITTRRITGSDVQTFLVNDPELQPAAYRPGDWLEPKDGSNQRMMIVGAGSVAAAVRTRSFQSGQLGSTHALSKCNCSPDLGSRMTNS